ncbi:MAG: hypothetical protein JRI68_23545, partial [Deltaproteobacteria bacterium]|nr:hypothetical protein [Deltaproteobacteria bacterium]
MSVIHSKLRFQLFFLALAACSGSPDSLGSGAGTTAPGGGGGTATGGAGGDATTATGGQPATGGNGGAGGVGGASGGEGGSAASGAAGGSGGGGGAPECTLPADCPGVDLTCSFRTCVNGMCDMANAAALTGCTEGGGVMCDGSGNCVECLWGQHCTSGVCQANVCAQPTCTDGIQNGTETGVDCGGSCSGCVNGTTCFQAADCLSLNCVDGVCCDGPCSGFCEACNMGGTLGSCTPLVGVDPANECGGGVCDGGGGCASGDHIWSYAYTGGQEHIHDLAIDSAGNILVSGEVSTGVSIDLGGGPLPLSNWYDLFLAKYDANGTHLWSKGFGFPVTLELSPHIAVDANDNVYIAGNFSQGDTQIGGAIISNGGGSDIFLAKFDAAGTHLWSKGLGGAAGSVASDIVVAANGDIVLGGSFSGSIDFGLGPMSAPGSWSDVFVARFDGAGNALWANHYGDSDPQYGGLLALDSAGNLVVAGSFFGHIDFGGG